MAVRLATVGIVCVTATVLAAHVSQQSTAPQQPTFTAGTQYVRVDLYVTSGGHLVDDLRRDEVTLLEDGVPQTIEKFERIAFRSRDPLTPAIEPGSIAAARELATDSRSRVFVVFIDPWHSAYVSAGAPEAAAGVQRRFPVLRQLEQAIGPDDLVAVMTPQMRPEEIHFSRGLAGLAQLEGEWTGPYSVIRPDPGMAIAYDKTELLYQACYPDPRTSPARRMIARRREKLLLDSFEELTSFLGDLRDERKAVLLVTDGWPLYLPDPTLTQVTEPPQTPVPPLGGRGRDGTVAVTERGPISESEADRNRCDAERSVLAGLDHRHRLESLIAHAQRNNVAIYPASPAGLTTDTRASGAGGPGTQVNSSPSGRQSDLKMLAEETDGYAIVNTNSPLEGIQRMMADSSSYYLLGYVTTNGTLDGRYRRITVRVSRGGVESRARPGYFAALPRTSSSRPIDPVAAAVDRLSNVVSLRGPLKLRGAPWVVDASGGTTGAFWIVGELDLQTRREATWLQTATADIVVTLDGGNPVFTGSADVRPAGPAVALRVPAIGGLAPGNYSVRVQIQAADRSARITETIPVTIPAAATGFGEAVLWRRGPSTGVQPVRTADPRFVRNERLRMELPVFAAGPVTARLLDRNGALLKVPVSVSERTEPSESFRWAVADVTLAPLAVGDYALEVTQGETKRVTAFRIVP